MSEAMKTYTIRAAAGEPGRAAVPRLETGCVLWLPDAGIRAFGQFCHDAEYLYVHLCAVERDIRAEYTAPLSPVCQDSCLEFFFMPEGEDRYLNFEVNPNGCLLAGFGRGRADRIFLHRGDLRELFGIRTAPFGPAPWQACGRHRRTAPRHPDTSADLTDKRGRYHPDRSLRFAMFSYFVPFLLSF